MGQEFVRNVRPYCPCPILTIPTSSSLVLIVLFSGPNFPFSRTLSFPPSECAQTPPLSHLPYHHPPGELVRIPNALSIHLSVNM